VLEFSPDNLKAMEAMFRVQAARKDWDALASITEKMKQAHPDKAIGYYYSGMLLREQGKVEQSIGEFERAVELAPGAIEPLTQLVRTHVSLEQPDNALEILDGILADNADNVFAQNLKGEMYLFKEDYDMAVDAFETAISMQPQWQLPYRNLANTYLLMKENEKAIGAYERGIDATGFSPLLVTDLARYFEISGNVDKAISLYEEVLVQDENNNLASNNLAMLLIDYRGDEQSLQRASVLVENLKDINNAAYQDTIGWLLYKQDRIEEAIPHLEKAVAASPDNVGLNYHLGMAYYKSGNKEGARKALTIATSTDQKYLGIEDARKALESL
ncbi:MAG: tetratricopeptide repeat protein, partial [Gammaproteobacteria bacterium]|nr:tetratricopeptide repeat protein [Gammaproteobacteria bacterium]